MLDQNPFCLGRQPNPADYDCHSLLKEQFDTHSFLASSPSGHRRLATGTTCALRLLPSQWAIRPRSVCSSPLILVARILRNLILHEHSLPYDVENDEILHGTPHRTNQIHGLTTPNCELPVWWHRAVKPNNRASLPTYEQYISRTELHSQT